MTMKHSDQTGLSVTVLNDVFNRFIVKNDLKFDLFCKINVNVFP